MWLSSSTDPYIIVCPCIIVKIYRKGEEDGGERDWGVRALEDIPAFSFVCSYIGEVLSMEDDEVSEDDPNVHHLVIRSDISETTYKYIAT